MTGVRTYGDIELFGWVLVDVLNTIKQTECGQKKGNCKLETAALYFLPPEAEGVDVGKMVMPYSMIIDKWLDAVAAPPHTPSRLYSYCTKDAYISDRLLRRFNITAVLCVQAVLIGQSPGVVATRANTSKFRSITNLFVSRKQATQRGGGVRSRWWAATHPPNRQARMRERGWAFLPRGTWGFKQERLPDGYVPAMTCINDFKSLYPSVMQDCNISFCTFIFSVPLLRSLRRHGFPLRCIRRLKRGEQMDERGNIILPPVSRRRGMERDIRGDRQPKDSVFS